MFMEALVRGRTEKHLGFTEKYLYKLIIGYRIHLVVKGEIKMSEFIWHWTNGNKKIYTKKTEVAEKAMKEGMLVMGTKMRPDIIRY